jgi:hypothetical protein
MVNILMRTLILRSPRRASAGRAAHRAAAEVSDEERSMWWNELLLGDTNGLFGKHAVRQLAQIERRRHRERLPVASLTTPS